MHNAFVVLRVVFSPLVIIHILRKPMDMCSDKCLRLCLSVIDTEVGDNIDHISKIVGSIARVVFAIVT